MRSLFEYGYECARVGRLWISSPGVNRDVDPELGPTRQGIACPADDEFLTDVPVTVNASP
jgi:hypothetical protein